MCAWAVLQLNVKTVSKDIEHRTASMLLLIVYSSLNCLLRTSISNLHRPTISTCTETSLFVKVVLQDFKTVGHSQVKDIKNNKSENAIFRVTLPLWTDKPRGQKWPMCVYTGLKLSSDEYISYLARECRIYIHNFQAHNLCTET